MSQEDHDRIAERHSTREIVADRITVLEQYGAHPLVSDGPRRLGHNPSWVKAIAYDALQAEVTRLREENSALRCQAVNLTDCVRGLVEENARLQQIAQQDNRYLVEMTQQRDRLVDIARTALSVEAPSA